MKPDRAYVRTRLSTARKQAFANLAQREGLTEAGLLRRLVRHAIATEEARQPNESRNEDDRRRRNDRLTIQIHPADRRALQERGAARNITASRYVTALVRAHIDTQPRLPNEEFQALRDLVEQLNNLAPTLNELVHAANQGEPSVEPLRDTLADLLQLFENISVGLRAFARANRRSWEAKLTDDSFEP